MTQNGRRHPAVSASPTVGRYLLLMALLAATMILVLDQGWMTQAFAAPAFFELNGTIDVVAAAEASAPLLDVQAVRTALLLMHVGGLLLGFGFTLFMDFFMLGRLYARPMDETALRILEFGSRWVSLGLALLWISGIGFLVLYGFAMPEKLGNPKIWAKLAIVCILTINGFYLHGAVLPAMQARQGAPLLAGLPLAQAFPFVAAGSISVAGWSFPTLFGLASQLNYSVPAAALFAAFVASAATLMCALAVVHLAANLRPQRAATA